ncbi:negative elongation factor E [Daktulosphaira vitifoliae]|uniref:negative elongation factor E n=1 Tax=Daktulosphaira vitifoliae TaxID=58002 RepID=UPI0021A9C926|nr:negative elongation factor E [Daktulosphaira vitifoliae]
MVYLHFPTNLTEEELMLQNKYQKLRKKKKALQVQKTPRPEPEPSPILNPKRPKETARDAREIARKLLKSGAIGPIKKVPNRTDQESFKRPCGMERKILSSPQTLTSYQPFSASSPIKSDPVENSPKPTTKFSNLYDNFVSSTSKMTVPVIQNSPEHISETPRKGITIFVGGSSSLTEEFLRSTFSKFGTIINISMEIEKNRGFITFNSSDIAEKAVAQMNSTTVSGIKLKVSISRNQPIECNEKGVNAWHAIATNKSQKGNQRDDRSLVSYDDINLF